MGCCASRPRSEQHEPSQGQPATVQLASQLEVLSPPSLRDPSRPSSSSNSVATSSGGRPPVPLDQHFNTPLQKQTWHTKAAKKPWTRSQWLKKREEFFDTRVTNRPEVWESLKAVVGLLDQEDIGTAQGILDAAEITLPTGNLVDGAYDSLGNLYRLPHYAVSAPSNMIEDGEQTTKGSAGGEASAYRTLDPGSSAGLAESPGISSSAEVVTVKARLSDRGGSAQDVLVSIGKEEPTAALIQAVAQKAKLPVEKVRIAYMGKILKPSLGLAVQGYQDGHVVNALVAT